MFLPIACSRAMVVRGAGRYEHHDLRENVMGKYHDLMEQDLCIRGYSEQSQRAYLGCVRRFVGFIGRPVSQLTLEDIQRYQFHIVRERKLCSSSSNQLSCALRFFFGVTLKKNWTIKDIPNHKRGRKLPVILSPEEVAALFEVTVNLKHRALLMTVYATGLRASETTHLRLEDIDEARGCIRVRQGKGHKDRLVMLSPHLLDVLQQYTARYAPDLWLFPGRFAQTPLTRTSLFRVCKKAARRAGLRKNVSPHALRHAFATHLLENGINIRIIQLLLGHRSIRTTEVYTHVARTFYAQTPSPLDSLVAEPAR